MTDFLLEHVFAWDVLLTIVGLTGFVLAGRKIWWAWYINIGCQALWFTYAIVTEQWGFIAAALAYTYVFTKNAIRWTREHRKSVDACRRFHPNEPCLPGSNHPGVVTP